DTDRRRRPERGKGQRRDAHEPPETTTGGAGVGAGAGAGVGTACCGATLAPPTSGAIGGAGTRAGGATRRLTRGASVARRPLTGPGGTPAKIPASAAAPTIAARVRLRRRTSPRSR